MVTMGELKKELDNFTGTQAYHRCSIVSNYLCTDGTKHLAEKANAFWLIDAIASYQRKEPFQVWTLVVKSGKGTLTMVEDTGQPELVKQILTYTDFPEGTIQIWVAPQDENMIMMLPSEY